MFEGENDGEEAFNCQRNDRKIRNVNRSVPHVPYRHTNSEAERVQLDEKAKEHVQQNHRIRDKQHQDVHVHVILQ